MTSFLAQAQTLDSVPASFWKYFCIGLMVLLGAAVGIVMLIVSFRKPGPVEINDQPPIEVRKAPKRFNYDLAEQRYSDHARRIQELEDWRRDLIKKLDADKAEMMRAGEERASRIHEHIEKNRGETDRKIEALPNNIIAMLKNTGAI